MRFNNTKYYKLLLVCCAAVIAGCQPPGSDLVPRLQSYNNYTSPKLNQLKYAEKIQHIALLLPMRGPLAVPGKTVRDGFMEAYFADSKQTQLPVKIRIYDTSKSNDITQTYQQAIADGAQVVVGPLARNNVEQLTNQQNLKVPTLALNYLTDNKRAPKQLYQFGISQDYEAFRIAEKAWQAGHRRALIISPDTQRAKQIVTIFRQQWHNLSGQVVAELSYNDKQRIDNQLKQILQINASKQRSIRIKRLLNDPKIKTTPRRRQDIDMIFLLANPSQGRQIRPLLKFYYAGELPVYATSMIYTGQPMPVNDKDLNDIIFCDTAQAIQQTANNKDQDSRLCALGFDAYRLSKQLDPNQTRIIQRQLTWLQFKHGQPTTFTPKQEIV